MKREEISMGDLIMANKKLYIVDYLQWDESKSLTGIMVCKVVGDRDEYEEIDIEDVDAVFTNELEG